MEEAPRVALDEERTENSTPIALPGSREIASFERQLGERLARIHSGQSERADISERLLFQIDDVCYSASLTMLREALLEIPPLAPLPFSPSWLLGLFPLRTDLVTLVDPRPLLAHGLDMVAGDVQFAPAQGELALLIGESGRLIALVVDRIGDLVTSPDASATLSVKDTSRWNTLARYVDGVYPLKDGETPEAVIALNVDAFYNDVISALEVWARHA